MILDGKKPLKTMVCLEDNPYLLGPGYIFRTNILSKCPEGCTLKNKDFESKKWRWIGDFRSIFFKVPAGQFSLSFSFLFF